MKIKTTIYLPVNEKGNRPSVSFETGTDNVKSIYQYGDTGIKITFDDDSSSVYYNMPFEYHEFPEVIDEWDVPF